MLTNYRRMRRSGFTLIETMTAVTVLTIGMLGIFGMLSLAQKNYVLSKNRLTGILLSQEGAELVRNIRDNNSQNGVAWNTGLAAGRYLVDYDTATQTVTLTPVFSAAAPFLVPGAQLKINGDRFTHTTGTATRWYRAITLENRDDNSDGTIDGLTVTSAVNWQDGGTIIRDYSTKVFLYNWYGQ